jgi:chromate transporter
MNEPREATDGESHAGRRGRLAEVALLFLRLGITAFGGPAAHIAIMEDEVVRRRRWITEERFLDLLGAVNLIPGPNSTEMAIYLGYLRAGWAGLLLGGVCFILPAMLMVMALAGAYLRFGSLPQFVALLYGVKPVVIAVVLQALWGLGRKAIKTPLLATVAVLVAVAGLAGADVLAAILLAGVAVGLKQGASSPRPRQLKPIVLMLAVAAAIYAASAAAARLGNPAGPQAGLQAIFLYFLKVGSVLYGSGYVLLAYLQADLVRHWHWLTSAQLLDATAVGQITPGPVFTTATFIGYVLGRVPGALVATAGIFLPSFLFVAVSGPLVPRLRKSPLAGAFLDGVNAASMALMAVVTWQLGRSAIVDLPTTVLVVTSAVFLVRFRVNSAWLILAGAASGLVLHAAAGG